MQIESEMAVTSCFSRTLFLLQRRRKDVGGGVDGRELKDDSVNLQVIREAADGNGV